MSNTDSESNEDAESFDKYPGIAEDDSNDDSGDGRSETPRDIAEIRGAIDELIEAWFPSTKVDELIILLDRLADAAEHFEKNDPLVCVHFSEVKSADVSAVIAESDDGSEAPEHAESATNLEQFIGQLYENYYLESELQMQQIIIGYVAECAKQHRRYGRLSCSPKSTLMLENIRICIVEVTSDQQHQEWCFEDAYDRLLSLMAFEVEWAAGGYGDVHLFGLERTMDDDDYAEHDHDVGHRSEVAAIKRSPSITPSEYWRSDSESEDANE